VARASASARGRVVRVVYPDHEDLLDFVVPTVEEALALIADGAINKLDLLEQAGLSTEQAEAELARVEDRR